MNTKQNTDFYSKLPLAEIRRRQRLNQAQISRAYEQRNYKALDILRRTETDLMHELMKRC